MKKKSDIEKALDEIIFQWQCYLTLSRPHYKPFIAHDSIHQQTALASAKEN